MASLVGRQFWGSSIANSARPILAASPPLSRGLYATRRLAGDPGPSASAPDPLLYPRGPTANHHDLRSFLRHAERSGLDPTSRVYVGTHYEYIVAASLARYGFSLQRMGGASDMGVDLLGTWTVPSSTQPLRVLVQCKAGVQKVGPHMVRELEGAFIGAPVGWKEAGVIGLLAAQKPATKGIRDSLGRSRWPMGFISCSSTGSVQQMIWNRRAEEEGLDGLGVGLRYGPDGENQVVLTWDGKHLPLLEGSPADAVERCDA